MEVLENSSVHIQTCFMIPDATAITCDRTLSPSAVFVTDATGEILFRFGVTMSGSRVQFNIARKYQQKVDAGCRIR